MPSTHFLGISTNFLLKSDSRHPQCGFHTANISKSFEESKQRPNLLKMFFILILSQLCWLGTLLQPALLHLRSPLDTLAASQ